MKGYFMEKVVMQACIEKTKLREAQKNGCKNNLSLSLTPQKSNEPTVNEENELNDEGKELPTPLNYTS